MLLAPVYPTLEISNVNLVAVYYLALEIAVYFVQVQAVCAGNERAGLEYVLAQLVDIACTAGIVSGCLYSAGERAGLFFEAHNVVCLPAVQRQVEVLHLFDNSIYIYADCSVTFLCHFVGFCD